MFIYFYRYETLEFGSGFSSEQCPEGIVAVTGNTLRILSVEKMDQVFNQAKIPLKYTPRRFLFHEPTRMFVILESDNNTWCPSDKKRILESKVYLNVYFFCLFIKL